MKDQKVSIGARMKAVPVNMWMRLILLPKLTRILLGLLVVMTALTISAIVYIGSSTNGPTIKISELSQLIKDGRVQEMQLLDQDHSFQGVARPGPGVVGEGLGVDGPFNAQYPSNDQLTKDYVQEMIKAGVPVEVDQQSAKGIVRLLTTTLLPILILANLFALLFTARNGALGEVEAFGQMDAAGRVGGSASFRDIAGVEEALEELNEVVDYLQNPERYASVGAVPPKGVLLFGPPGCGKTLLAKAVAGEAGVPFFSVAGAEFVESLVGVGAARVRDLFAKVRAVAPAIVFIDELDAAGRRRGSGSGGGSEERDQTLNQMLVEMDGFEISSGIVVMAATNRPDILDPALLRPGRFDRHIIIDRPDVTRREAILKLHAAKRTLEEGIDFEALSRQTPGFTGADLANVLNEAALLTIRMGKPRIDQQLLSEAVQRVLGGPQRRGHLLTDDERRRVACHEAGHAVAAALLGRAAKVHRVSIVARGRGMGSTGLEREETETVRTAMQLQARIAVALAGRAAEEQMLGEASTGAEDDLELATNIAREMSGRYGLTPEVGLLSILPRESGHLGPRGPEPLAVSEAEWAAFDNAVRRILDEGHVAARGLLDAGREAHERLTKELLEHEQIEGKELQPLLPEPLDDGVAHQLLTGRRNGRARKAPAARTAKSEV